MDFPNKIAVARLNDVSVEYQTYWREWRDLDLMSEGGIRLRESVGQIESGILVRRPKEPTDVYVQRVARFTYQPILPNVVSWYTSKMFEKEPTVTGLPVSPFWVDFPKDVDRAGSSLRNLASDVFETAFVFSSAFVLTDLPAIEGKFESLQDQVTAKALDPYLTVFNPMSICNYSIDRYGMLEWIVIKTTLVEPVFNAKAQNVTEWRIFDRENYALYRNVSENAVDIAQWSPLIPIDSKADAELVSTGKHALSSVGRVPVRRVTMRKPMRLARRAYSQLLDHVNQDNTFAWALFNANLAMPYFIGAGDMIPTLSEVGWWSLPDGASVGWLEPGGQTFTHAQNRLDSLRQEIYRSFHLQAQGRDSSATAASSSGYSKELEMMPAEDMMDGFGEFMRETIQLLLKDVADAHGDDSTDINVAWARYDSKVTLEEVTLGEAVDTVPIQSDTFFKIRDKRVAMAYMEDEDQKLKDIVVAEIDAAPGKSQLEEIQRQQQVQTFQQSLATAGNRSLAKNEVAQETAAVA